MCVNVSMCETFSNGTLNRDNEQYCNPSNNILPFMFASSGWVPHVGAGLAYILIIQNIIIIRIFLKKELLSSASILLSVLALSDTFSVFFWFFPEHIGAFLECFKGVAFGSYSMITAFYEKYPFCVFAHISRNILSSGFHSTAVFLTTALGIQKTMFLLFPTFSKTYLNKKFAVIVSLVIILICLGLEMPYAIFFDFTPLDNGECCKDLNLAAVTVRKFFDFSHHLRSGIVLVSVVVQLATTSYITLKLTCLRKTLWRDSKTVRRRNRRSAIIVIYITLIFILSELPSVVVSICLELRIAPIFTGQILQYLALIISFGCFFNFWLYLALSQRFRRELNVSRKSLLRRRSSYIIV